MNGKDPKTEAPVCACCGDEMDTCPACGADVCIHCMIYKRNTPKLLNDGGEIVHQADKECWKVKGEDDPVLEVWESYNGDLYFITEKDDVSGCVFMYARLYAMPQFAEWGSNNINYLREQYGCDKLWLVPKKNWANIDTYEKGLLVQCQSASPKVAAPSFFAPQSQREEALSPRVSVFFPFLHAGAGAPSCAGICLI